MQNNITFDAKPSARRKDENGILHVSLTPISKAVVNPYYGAEIPGGEERGLKAAGIYYGLRDPTELEKAAPTFNGLPVLLEHHDYSADNPQTRFRVGSTGTDATFDAPYLLATLAIQDAEAIEAIESGGFKEISAAYRFEPDFTPGDYQGTRYDFVMREIRGNHVALVPKGRAGRDVAVADGLPDGINQENPIDIKLAKDERSNKMSEKEKEKNELAAKGNQEEKEDKAKDTDEAAAAEEKKAKPAFDNDALAELKAMIGEILAAVTTGKAPAPAKDSEPEKNEKNEKKDDEEKTEAAAPKVAADSAKEIEAKIRQEFREKSEAGAAVKSILGNIDVLAFDSAEDIYAKALEVKGVNPKSYPKEAYQGMVEMVRKEARAPLALDSFKDVSSADETLKHLDNVKVI